MDHPHRRAALWLFICCLGLGKTALAAPKAELWAHWEAHDPEAGQVIDHSAWDGWLKRFVQPGDDGINRIAYAAVDADSHRQLKKYIETLAALPISRYRREQQQAYWINLYNAITVDVVLDDYPVDSIRDISSGFLSFGPWKRKRVSIEGEKVSLDDIEHRILRPIWRDARIHYAVNCASIGCPNLQPQAFTAANTEQLLERAAREFVNHPRGVAVIDGKLEVSSIYDWFEQDFGEGQAGVIAHLRRYADAELGRQLNGIERISGDSYDWDINAAGSR